jgi:FdhD protein
VPSGVQQTATVRRMVERVTRVDGAVRQRRLRDALATEEPLEIRLVQAGVARPVSVTMRTPGSDVELAAGFLFGEAIVQGAEDVLRIETCATDEGGQAATVHLASGAAFDPATLERHFYTTSSCGVCGKASIEAVLAAGVPEVEPRGAVPAELLLGLPARLRARQAIFERTGGLHAAARFDRDGALLDIREDVGRHNAMDKLVGAALLGGGLPLTDEVLMVSGRLSFELVQKAARAGAGVLAGVSAPSSLAVELAERAGMTLVGFLREDHFNVYCGSVGSAADERTAGGLTG